MAQAKTHFKVYGFRQADRQSPAEPMGSHVLKGPATIEAAVREAAMFQAQHNPTYIEVREVSRAGERVVHTSDPVFPNA